MELLSNNLKYLRKQHYDTQEEMAKILGMKKSTYASYESGAGNMPTVQTLYEIARHFKVSMESLVETDYTTLKGNHPVKISEREVYFPVSVDSYGNELVDIIPADHQAQAGYLSEHTDPSYIQTIPKIHWDFGIHEPGTKRMFQIAGDSMLPIPSKSYILTRKSDYESIRNGYAYIIVTDNDILFKRLEKDEESVHLLSDNAIYPPQKIHAEEIKQYWEAIKVIMDLPEAPIWTLDALGEKIIQTNDRVQELMNIIKKD